MQEFDIPIFKKAYELYKQFHEIRNKTSKQDRYTVFQKCENYILELIEKIIEASQLPKESKSPVLDRASLLLSLLRVFVRLMKDTKSIDLKNYALIEANVDEIGRMLGGWIKSTKEA